MSQPFDLSLFPDFPLEVVETFAAQKAALEAARFEATVKRAARQHEQAVVAEKDAFITELKALIEKLEGQALDYRRTKGRNPRNWTRRSWNWRWKTKKPPSPRPRHGSRPLKRGWGPANRTLRKVCRERPPRRRVRCPKACRAWSAWSSLTALRAPAAAGT